MKTLRRFGQLDYLNRQISEAYNDLLEKALEPYGINRNNVGENVNRVVIHLHTPICSPILNMYDFYIDNKYAFSIQINYCREDAVPDTTIMIEVKVLKGENKNAEN